MWDGLQEILFSLRQNKLRTVITGFGVFWGIFMLIVMLGSGQGMRNGAEASWGTIARDTINFSGGLTKMAYKGTPIDTRVDLTIEDAEMLKSTVPGIRFIAIENVMMNTFVSYEKQSGNFHVVGVDREYFHIKDTLPFLAGRKFDELDFAERRKVASIGKPVAERLFGSAVASIGQQIKIKEIHYTVVSVFDDDDQMGQAANRIFLPLTTYKATFNPAMRFNQIYVRPAFGVDGYDLENKILASLKLRHNVSPDDNRGVSSYNRARNVEGMNKVFFGINMLIWFVGIGTLMAGIVGVSNIMIITVKERTREIGIRKALGATPTNIVSTLILESVLVTAFAGYVGLVIGVGLLSLVSLGLEKSGANIRFFKEPEIDFQVAITAIIILVVAGAVAGFFPAIKAARIPPVEAMRQD